MNYRLKAWHVLLAGPVVQFLVGAALVVAAPLGFVGGHVGGGEGMALLAHAAVVLGMAVVAAVFATVPLVLFALGRLRRVAAVLSALLAVGFVVLPSGSHPATWSMVGVFALAAVLGWREAGRGKRNDADEATAEDADAPDDRAA